MLKIARLAIGVAVVCVLGAIGYGVATLRESSATQRGADQIELAQATPPKPGAAPKRPAIVVPTPAAPVPTQPNPDAAAEAKPAPATFSGRLGEAGVKTCLAQFDDLGGKTMDGVTAFVPASNWNATAPEAHMASVLIGQKYGNSAKLPFGLTGIVGAPDGHGKCDGVSFQILPSPASCESLQQNILQKGKLLGNLAGLPFLQDVNSQVVLIPTAGPGCVLVAIRTEYAPN